MDSTTKWDRRFLELAKTVSTWSKDPGVGVGAVIVRPDRTVAALGYNGFPRKLKDTFADLSNREVKLSKTIHAEMNAILTAKENLKGYTIYIYPFMPCDRCAVHIIQTGIARVVSFQSNVDRWRASFDRSQDYLVQASIDVRLYPDLIN